METVCLDIPPQPRQHWGMDVIDARGLMCPLPVLRLAKVLRNVEVGTVVTVWADDPIAVIDIPHYCVESGNLLVSQSDDSTHQVYVIKRQ